jgi:hypothetical protein
VATRAKAKFCGHPPVGIAVSNTAREHGRFSLVNIVFCQVEVIVIDRWGELSSRGVLSNVCVLDCYNMKQ